MTRVRIDCAAKSLDRLGETPLWCTRIRRLWWLDVEDPKLQSIDPATGVHDASSLPGTYAGTQALTKSGGRILAEDLTLYVRDNGTGNRSDLLTVETGFDNRLNDGRVDARGRFWVGTMDNASKTASSPIDAFLLTIRPLVIGRMAPARTLTAACGRPSSPADGSCGTGQMAPSTKSFRYRSAIRHAWRSAARR
jgi:sugar lactone lactonase YvrE